MKQVLLLSTFALGLFASSAWSAGGSFNTKTSEPSDASFYQIAQQIVANPTLAQKWAELQSRYVISQVGVGTMLGKNYKNISGMRVGPFILLARDRKGSVSDGEDFDVEKAKFEVKFNTQRDFMTRDGQVLTEDDRFKATSVVETLSNIEVNIYTPEEE